MPTVSYELPYDGAKEMLLVDEVDNREYLMGLFETMFTPFYPDVNMRCYPQRSLFDMISLTKSRRNKICSVKI
jgi:hypothetical protein